MPIPVLSAFERKLASLDPSLEKPQIKPPDSDLSSLDEPPAPSKEDIDLEDGVIIEEDPYDDTVPDVLQDSDFDPQPEDDGDVVKSEKVLAFQLLTLPSQIPPDEVDSAPARYSNEFHDLVDSIVDDAEDDEDDDDHLDMEDVPLTDLFPAGFDGADEDDETEGNEEDDSPEEEEVAFFDFISSYFAYCPSPSDDQIHALATSIGVDHEELERRIYKLMSLMLENEEISEEARETLSKILPR